MIRCSELPRVKACPGSPSMCEGISDKPSTPESESGTRIHDMVARMGFGEKLSGVEEGEAKLASDLCLQAELEIEGFFPKQSVTRFWEEAIENKELNLSGHPDLYAINDEHNVACIIDYKTGWLDQTPADRNIQLRGYAVLLWSKYPKLMLIRVVLIERNMKVTRADYCELDIKRASEEIYAITNRLLAYEIGNPRYAGQHCRYCRANAHCPEAASFAVALAPPAVAPVSKVEAKDIASKLSVKDMATFLSRWGVAQKIAEAVRDRAKEMARNGEEVPWALKEGNKRAVITDTRKAYELIAPILCEGIQAEQFASCCDVGIGALEKIIASNTGMSAKDAKEEVRNRLASVIEYKQNEPSLVMKGEE